MDQENAFVPNNNSKPLNWSKIIKWTVICILAIIVIAGITVGVYYLVKETGVQNRLNELTGIIDSFENGENYYFEAASLADSYQNDEDQRVIDRARDTIETLKTLKEPTNAYYDALEFENNEKYLSAILEFKKVSDVSKNYEDAQSKLIALEEKAIQEVESEISGLVEDENYYNKAINLFSSLYSVYQKDTYLEKLNTLKTNRDQYLAEKKAAEEAAEEARKAQQAQEEREKAVSALQISRCWVTGPDFVGGYELHCNWTNKSPKTVKYFLFGVTFYDPVGEPIETWRIDKIEYCKDVGPFEPWGGRSGSNWHWGKYYDSIIDHPEIVYVAVEYMDGTVWILNENEIAAVQY